MDELALIAPRCRWTAGTWDELDRPGTQMENTTRHISELSSYLIRLYAQAKAARR